MLQKMLLEEMQSIDYCFRRHRHERTHCIQLRTPDAVKYAKLNATYIWKICKWIDKRIQEDVMLDWLDQVVHLQRFLFLVSE